LADKFTENFSEDVRKAEKDGDKYFTENAMTVLSQAAVSEPPSPDDDYYPPLHPSAATIDWNWDGKPDDSKSSQSKDADNAQKNGNAYLDALK
jgi:hypothetical protein